MNEIRSLEDENRRMHRKMINFQHMLAVQRDNLIDENQELHTKLKTRLEDHEKHYRAKIETTINKRIIEYHRIGDELERSFERLEQLKVDNKDLLLLGGDFVVGGKTDNIVDGAGGVISNGVLAGATKQMSSLNLHNSDYSFTNLNVFGGSNSSNNTGGGGGGLSSSMATIAQKVALIDELKLIKDKVEDLKGINLTVSEIMDLKIQTLPEFDDIVKAIDARKLLYVRLWKALPDNVKFNLCHGPDCVLGDKIEAFVKYMGTDGAASGRGNNRTACPLSAENVKVLCRERNNEPGVLHEQPMKLSHTLRDGTLIYEYTPERTGEFHLRCYVDDILLPAKLPLIVRVSSPESSFSTDQPSVVTAPGPEMFSSTTAAPAPMQNEAAAVTSSSVASSTYQYIVPIQTSSIPNVHHQQQPPIVPSSPTQRPTPTSYFDDSENLNTSTASNNSAFRNQPPPLLQQTAAAAATVNMDTMEARVRSTIITRPPNTSAFNGNTNENGPHVVDGGGGGGQPDVVKKDSNTVVGVGRGYNKETRSGGLGGIGRSKLINDMLKAPGSGMNAFGGGSLTSSPADTSAELINFNLSNAPTEPNFMDADNPFCQPSSTSVANNAMPEQKAAANNYKTTDLDAFSPSTRSNEIFAAKGEDPSNIDQQLTRRRFDLTSLMTSGRGINAKFQFRLGTPRQTQPPEAFFFFPIGCTKNERNGDILVCDTRHDAVKIFSATGYPKILIDGYQNPQFKFTNPSAVVALDSNDFVVKDNHALFRFASDGNLQESFGKGRFKRIYGLCLDDEGYLLTVDLGTRPNVLYTICPTTGRVYRELEFTACRNVPGSKCRFMDYYNKNLVIADLGAHQVYVCDDFGELKFTFGGLQRAKGEPGKFNEPSGVAIDSQGTILVGDSRNDRVQIWSNDGRWLSDVKFSDRIVRPSDIHLTSDGQLLIMNYIEHYVSVYQLEAASS